MPSSANLLRQSMLRNLISSSSYRRSTSVRLLTKKVHLRTFTKFARRTSTESNPQPVPPSHKFSSARKSATHWNNNPQQSVMSAPNLTYSSAAIMAQQHVSSGEEINSSKGLILKEFVAVIRYQPDDERFQMQITLYSGKTFNFDRKCTDSISAVVTRMVANISKKVKKFDGTVKFITGENLDENEEIEKVLAGGAEGSTSWKLQVGQDIYDVIFNPPEVYATKFFGCAPLPGLPLFPYRMETSSNFSKERSLYEWSFSRHKPKPVPLPPKLRKKIKDESSSTADATHDETWVKCGSSLVLTPTSDMVGGYLRFCCVPSNGKIFGKPFELSLPQEVQPLPVEKFLFQERLSRLAPKLEDECCFRVLSYNVLADTYATPEWFISSPKESLDAGYRLPILNQEIQSYQADIICLQEVDEKYFEGNFQPYLETQGYKGFHQSKTRNTKEGIAAFYNPQKLSHIKSYVCVILDHMKTLPFWDKLIAVSKEFTERLEERNTVFQLSVFCLNAGTNKTLLVVGNVHLFFHPDADHLRLLQTITCLSFLESTIAQLKEQIPESKIAVIYCGDMNCTPPFSSYRLLTSGKVEESDYDWTSHPTEKLIPGISFRHDFNLTNSHPGEELTNITTCFEGCLDYIMYQAEHFELLGTCPVPSKEELAALMKFEELRKVSLPNFYTPSDHLPIIADFRLK